MYPCMIHHSTGSSTTTSITHTDQVTLTHAWSLELTINFGSAVGKVAGVPQAIVKGGYSGSKVQGSTDTKVNTQTTSDQTTVTSTVLMVCPKEIPNDTTCTWSGVWAVGHSLPPSPNQKDKMEFQVPVAYTLIGGGVMTGYVAGLISATVQSKTTSVYVQCKVNGTWIGFGDQPYL